jgi:hypothetical protein
MLVRVQVLFSSMAAVVHMVLSNTKAAKLKRTVTVGVYCIEIWRRDSMRDGKRRGLRDDDLCKAKRQSS